jgi:hypothetical protein
MQTSGQSKHAGRRIRRLNRVVFGGLLLVTGTLSALSTLGGQSGQQTDTRPRVFVEPGPPSDLLDEARLRSEVDSFSESFPNFCSRVLVTANRDKATHVIRLSIDGSGTDATDAALTFRLAVFNKTGDQVFSDAVVHHTGDPTEGIRNPETRLTREACAVVGYELEQGMVHLVAKRAAENRPRVYVKAALQGVTDDKALKAASDALGLVFSEGCFFVQRADDPSGADYVLEFDESKAKDALTVSMFDRSGKKIISDKKVFFRSTGSDALMWIKDACNAILSGESQK